jgi:hypothetical protein
VSAEQRSTVVFAVCHPDDEALWIGGILRGLAQAVGLRVLVICLSGNDDTSPRAREFEEARAAVGYDAGVVLGGPLRPALEPLPPTSATLVEGLRRLDVRTAEVDLLVTHSPYGDEHANPHHMQAHLELDQWSAELGVPFGYFSYLPMPFFVHRPLLRSPQRLNGSFHLIDLSRCSPTVRTRIMRSDPRVRRRLRCPRYRLLFDGDAEAKRRMLACYASVDLAAHREGYAAFTSACEGIYVYDDAGLEALRPLLAQLRPPDPADLFGSFAPRGPAALAAAAARRLARTQRSPVS